MRRLLLAPLCLFTACAGGASARRPVAPAPPPGVTPPASPLDPRLAALVRPDDVLTWSTTEDVARTAAQSAPLGALALTGTVSHTVSAVAASIVERAVQLLGLKRLSRAERGVPDDCSGLVRAAYLKAGIDLVSHGFLAGENAVTAIYRRAETRGALHQGEPQPGDLVFFRETYDRNRDGRRNDGLTHVAVVERVAADGTLTFIHRGLKGIARSHMNLGAPRTHRVGQDGPVINDYLRPAARGQRAWLTGELFAGFASPGAL